MARKKKPVTRGTHPPNNRTKDPTPKTTKQKAKKEELKSQTKTQQILAKASDMSPEEIAEKLGIEL